MSSSKVKCTCGWSWNKSDSSKKDMYICHECGRDNSNNMKNGGWLDNYNDSEVSLPEGYVGEGYNTSGRDYSPAWGGQFEDGGLIPIAQNGRATRADSLAVYNNSKQVEDFYKKQGYKYKERLNSFKIKPEDTHKENDNAYNNFSHVNEQVGGNWYGNPTITKNDYRKNIDKNKYYQREIPYEAINIDAPIQLFDRRILPKSSKTIGKDIDVVTFGSYNNIANKPFDLLTEAEKKLRVEKYGTDGVPKSYLSKTSTKKEIDKPIKSKPKPVEVKPQLQPRVEALNLRPIEQAPINIPVQELDFNTPIKAPKSYNVSAQRYNMQGPSDYYQANEEGVDYQRAMEIKAASDTYNKYIQEKYGNEDALKNPKAVERLKQLRQNVEVVPQYQMGGKLTFLQPTSEKLPQGYRIPYADPSSELAMSIGGEDGEPAYLIPSFKYGRPLENPMEEFKKTGEHLGGPFKTWQEADRWEQEVRHPYVEKGQAIPMPIKTWGEMAMGGSIPGSVGFTYARTNSPAPSNGKYAKKTMASAQEGKTITLDEGDGKKRKILTDSKEYADLYNEDRIGVKNDDESISFNPFNEVVVTPYDKQYPYYQSLSEEEKKYFNSDSPIGRQLRSRAQDNVGFNADKATDFAMGWLRDLPLASLQAPQSALVETVEALRGNDFNMLNALEPDKQRIPSETWGVENPYAAFAVDALTDPETLTGMSLLKNPLQKGIKQLKNIPTSISPELRQGLRTNGISFKPKFNSEIDWGKWNKEIPDNTQLMKEYNAIEQQAKADGTWMKYEKKVLDEEKTLNNKKLFDEQEKEFNIKNAQEEEVRKSLYEADKAKIKIEETNKLLDSKFQDYFDNASAQWKRNFENDPESKLEFLDVKGITSKEIDNALESLSSNVKNREADLLTKYKSMPINKFDRPNESVYTTSIEDFLGTPEQFIQVNSENFKKAYPEGWETVWRGGDRNPELNTKYIKDGEVIFTTKDEYGANVYNRSDNPEIKLSNTETPQEGLTKLYAPKTENKIVIDGDDSYIYDGRRISGDNYRKNYARLNALDQTPITSLQQENLNTFQKWMRKNYPEVDLTDRTMTDHFASFLNSPEGRNIDRVEFKKIFDGTIEPIDVEVHNLNNQKQLKSMFGNNGMFDITNPNIYKSVLPIGLGLGAASQLEQKREGGIIKDDRGQWAHPGEITEINSPYITMQGVPYPVLGVSDEGDVQMMYPEEEYEFVGKKVTEFPMAKNGLRQEQKGLVNLDQLTNFTNYNKPQPGGWLNKYN